MKDQLILERLQRLDEYVSLLEDLRGRKGLDKHLMAALERHMHLAIECCLDIGEMVIAMDGLPRPETYRGVIKVLTEAGVLEEPFGRDFEGVAGLRNILVHDYARVDHRRLRMHLGRIDDFRTFAAAVGHHLGRRG